MTHNEIDKIVTEWADDIADRIANREIARDYPNDAIFEAVDDGWGDLGFTVGAISNWPTNPGADIMRLLGDVLDYCEKEAWLEDDQGLWEGLTGVSIIGSQAFFSLQNVLWQKLRNANVIDC